jgi:hypothetical protein
MMRFNLGLPWLALSLCGVLAFTSACSSKDDVSSEEDARLAYIGLHRMVDRTINLGMDGYNAATSANIPSQDGTGDVSGTITISGQVDAGVSANKEMRLFIDLVDYRDDILDEDDEVTGIVIIYNTDLDPDSEVDAGLADGRPFADISLRNIPNGTFFGSLTGTFQMTGDLEGRVHLDLELSGQIEEVPDTDGEIRRVRGTTEVTGTAESRYGIFEVDLLL